MAKSTATSKQSKKPVSDCHCEESKTNTASKSKEKKSTRPCDCTNCK